MILSIGSIAHWTSPSDVAQRQDVECINLFWGPVEDTHARNCSVGCLRWILSATCSVCDFDPATAGETISEGGFKKNQVSSAALLDVQKATDSKGKTYYKYDILSRSGEPILHSCSSDPQECSS